MYALAATATAAGMLASAPAADAKIVYTSANVQVVGKPFPLDLNHDGKVDFFLLHYGYGFHTATGGNALMACHVAVINYKGTRFVCESSSQGTNALNAIRVTNQDFGAALRRGDKIQHGGRFRNNQPVDLGVVILPTSTQTGWYGPWVNGGKGVKNRYLGIKFQIGGRFHFGWARLTVTTQGNIIQATLTGYAYETIPGKAIIAGDKGPNRKTVEPVSLGHLAAGASAIPAWRLKHTAATIH